MPYDIQVGAITRALVAKYFLKGSPSFKLDEIITPVAVVDTLEDLTVRRCAGRDGTGATVGEFGHVQLKNPVLSGIQIKTIAMTGVNLTGSTVQLQFHDADLPTLSADTRFLDRRLEATYERPAGQIRSQTSATHHGQNEIFAIYRTGPTTDPLSFEKKIVIILNPGQAVVATPTPNNNGIEVNWEWVETTLPANTPA